jgi:hypothetical protein
MTVSGPGSVGAGCGGPPSPGGRDPAGLHHDLLGPPRNYSVGTACLELEWKTPFPGERGAESITPNGSYQDMKAPPGPASDRGCRLKIYREMPYASKGLSDKTVSKSLNRDVRPRPAVAGLPGGLRERAAKRHAAQPRLRARRAKGRAASPRCRALPPQHFHIK